MNLRNVFNMFDFPIKESTIGTSLFCLFFYLALLLTNYRYGLKYPFCRQISDSKRKWTLFLIAFFFVFHCLQGDFFHMMQHVADYSPIPGAWNFGEEIYHKIAFAVNKNYILFRLIIWGGAFLLFCLTSKRMNIPVYYSAVLLLATHSIIFAYARVTAAMAMYFWGLSFLCRPYKIRWLSYVIGILIIIFSLEFHRSAILMAVMTPMLFVPIRKWSIVLLLILLPALSVAFSDILFEISMSEGIDDMLAQKVQYYSDMEKAYGISGILISFLQYVSFYVPFVLVTMCIFSKNTVGKVPIELLRMYKVTFGLVTFSVLFFIIGGAHSTFVYRVLFMSMIPLTLIVVGLHQYNLMSRKFFSWCVISGISFMTVKYIYTVYCHLV